MYELEYSTNFLSFTRFADLTTLQGLLNAFHFVSADSRNVLNMLGLEMLPDARDYEDVSDGILFGYD